MTADCASKARSTLSPGPCISPQSTHIAGSQHQLLRMQATMGVDMRLLTRRRVVSGDEVDSGEASLNKLGYKQELSRGFGFINNAAMSFRSDR